MTLEQYMNQQDPQRMPNVQLERAEIHIGGTINILGSGTLSNVWIIDGCAKALWGVMYVKWGHDSTLYTTDADGNPKNRSCFHLKN